MISVVIPCYNAERFLVETVESVFAQSYTEVETILVDDGSTDGTAALMRSFGARVRAEFPPHGGASAARERGTRIARGEFIQYLDSDDLLTPDSLERKMEAILRSGADVAYCDWVRYEERAGGRFEDGEAERRRIEDVHARPEIAAFTTFWSPPAALLYRRSTVHKIGGWSPSLPVIQDARFLLDAALSGARFVHVPGIGARYRVFHGSSLSRGNRAAFLRDIFNNADEVRARLGGIPDGEWKKAFLRVYGYVARSAFETDKPMFERACERLKSIDARYRPESPWHLKIASSVFGYPRAEEIALVYRRAKGLLGGGS
ncbi:MAG TPA: glycosyltransferase [Candidatus Eisenbacteria bacterium]|nr:glycosyltransferase [Candidatus Eisenbacteria bacterium]